MLPPPATATRSSPAASTTSRRCRWTPSRVLEVLRNPTYAGQLPFNGEAHQAQHAPLVDAEVSERAQLKRLLE
ncbi:MAG TPA: recombinase family protein [Streptosporangiaceae bacterium]